MSEIPTITIDFDNKCEECGKSGKSNNGLCLNCTNKAIKGKTMKSKSGKIVKKRFDNLKRIKP